MLNPQVERFVRLIQEKLPTHESPEGAAQAVQRDFEAIAGPLSRQNIETLAVALATVKSKLQNVEILRRSSLVKPREDWYHGPMPPDRHWPALRGYLENAKNWDCESIQSIDQSSSEIVSLLANPVREQFRCRGLVVGYVQSGKTANMTAVIAKAVDAGYNLIVLLAGVTNKLRAQTQRRLQSDIIERHRHLWQLYTTAEEDGDFVVPANRQFTMPVSGRAQLAVMKKESGRLSAFLRTIERTQPAILKSLKTLIIDDECDQASVNSAADEFEMTKINEAIRKIINALPAVSYVGYTATPFANVFINPFPHNKEQLDDLYPEDFITDLSRPKDYFGTREVFGFDPDDATEEGGPAAGLDMVRIIPQEEVARVRAATSRRQSSFNPQVTVGLEKALIWFLVTCALRRMRHQDGAHMTMLIHTSPNIAQHRAMAHAIRAWIAQHSSNLAAGRGEVWRRLNALWSEETCRVPLAGEGESRLRPKDLIQYLRDALSVLEVVIENSASLERLNYTEEPKTYVVVGGSVLARGLTLEGLVVSFFLRTSHQYDTLLQMGRWFGFRHGYADLPRLWTTRDLAADFRALARIEEEIREDIAMYRSRDATPLDFAVKVREIPGMAITSAAKMRHAFRTSISFAGKHVQTIRFDHQNSRVVAENWDAACDLVDAAKARGHQAAGKVLFEDVPFEVVRRFLAKYEICDKHLDLKKEMLLDYLDKSSDSLKFWDVAVITPSSGNSSAKPLGCLGRLTTNRRSRLATTDDYADIKALMSKEDILVDALDAASAKTDTWQDLKAKRPATPLLLIYPVDRESAPRRPNASREGRPVRVPLRAVGDLIGMGIVFPGSLDRSGATYAVELDVPTPDQLGTDEEEDEVDG